MGRNPPIDQDILLFGERLGSKPTKDPEPATLVDGMGNALEPVVQLLRKRERLGRQALGMKLQACSRVSYQ